MKTHDNRVLFSKALLKAATCLFLTAGAGMSPVFALPGTAESMKMEITQQTVTVSGVVKDKKGEPIIGANIMEKGTTNGTITDFEPDKSALVHCQYHLNDQRYHYRF